MAPICGIPAQTLREVARAYATAKGAMILWGMGISQQLHGTDNARCLIALATVTGQIGKPGSGLHPLRGQNTVQGASDAGLIPMMYPNYQRVTNPATPSWKSCTRPWPRTATRTRCAACTTSWATLHVRQDDGTPTGAVFIPFAYYEAAANLMTNAALDPFGKIPEFKNCAATIERGGMLAASAGYTGNK